jgi:hypothetical protein
MVNDGRHSTLHIVKQTLMPTAAMSSLKTKDWSKAPSFPAPAGAGETKWVVPEKFFDQFPQVLQTVPPLPGEEALYGLFKAMIDDAGTERDGWLRCYLAGTPAPPSSQDVAVPFAHDANRGSTLMSRPLTASLSFSQDVGASRRASIWRSYSMFKAPSAPTKST